MKNIRKYTVSKLFNSCGKYMPFVRLQGAWLEQVGFCAGDKIVAHIEEGRIVLVKDDK